MQQAMLGFQLLYNCEGKHLNNINLMGNCKRWDIPFIIDEILKRMIFFTIILKNAE